MLGVRVIVAVVMLVGLTSVAFGDWSDWEAVVPGRLVWLRIDTRPMFQGRSRIHYQFRNDSMNPVSIECNFRSFEDGKPMDNLVRERIEPGVSDTEGRFVVGDGTLVTDRDVK